MVKNMINLNEIISNIHKKKLSVCIIGIGRIGLPTALSFAKAGFNIIGIDINENLVKMINSGEFPLKDEPDYDVIFDEVMKNKKFSATTKINETVPNSDIILLSLPTPMDKQNVPDYSALKSVGKQLANLISVGSLVIVESTVEPGFIENELIPIIENGVKKFRAGIDFEIGVCPETANPGEILKDFQNLPRLVGSINDKTVEIISEFYRSAFDVELIKMPNCKTANAVKLTTNVFRDLNIAFVNELAVLFENLGIDIMTVLEAAKTKYNFQIHYPGPGVGGPCLPINSYQYLNTAKKFDLPLKLVKTARTVNESMPLHVVKLLSDAFEEQNQQIRGSTVLLLGVSYKPDVKDIQISPAEKVIEKLKELNVHVRIYDPYFISKNIFGIDSEINLIDALSTSDGVILITPHKEFYNLKPTFLKSKLRNPIFIDTRCILNQHEAINAGLIYRGLGRGKL
jgi:nucleotide sugar dehydrogenase